MRRANPRRDPRGSGAKQSSTGRGSRNQTSDHKKRAELLIKSVQDGKISAMEEAGKERKSARCSLPRSGA